MNGIQRLEVLADWLENNVLDEVFNMSTWSCGTTACAVGHGCQCPALRAEGLQMDGTVCSLSYPVFNNETGYHAAAEFFELSIDTAEGLFGFGATSAYGDLPISQIKPQHVAAAIRYYIALKNIKTAPATAPEEKVYEHSI